MLFVGPRVMCCDCGCVLWLCVVVVCCTCVFVVVIVVVCVFVIVLVVVIVCWLRSGGEHYQPRLAVEGDAEDEKEESTSWVTK